MPLSFARVWQGHKSQAQHQPSLLGVLPNSNGWSCKLWQGRLKGCGAVAKKQRALQIQLWERQGEE